MRWEDDPAVEEATRDTVEVVRVLREGLTEEERKVFDAKLNVIEGGRKGTNVEIALEFGWTADKVGRIWRKLTKRLRATEDLTGE